jgi:hypothetical protein
MKDKELKVEEIEASHTLGGALEGRVQGRGKWRVRLYMLLCCRTIHYNHMVAQRGAGDLVGRARTKGPVSM